MKKLINDFGDKKMAVNLELKMKIDSVDDVIEKLQKVGAEEKETLNQKDIYYENKIGLIKLRIENNTFKLIQYLREEDKLERWSHYEVLNISDTNAEEFLARIFNVETEVVKVRRLFTYLNSRIHIDQVEKLGDFIEIETVVKFDRDSAKLEFEKLIDALNIDINKQIKKSYRNLIEEI